MGNLCLMLSKIYFKNLARKYYKRTLAGPGKFGVFILLCLLIIFSFETLGLSNIESNLEIRTINKRVIPVVKIQEKKANSAHSSYKSSSTLDNKLKISNKFDNERKKIEMERILLIGAVTQQNYENNLLVQKIEEIESLGRKMNMNRNILKINNRNHGNDKIEFFDA